MKGKYTIQDRPLFDALKLVTDSLYDEGTRYAVMGGVGCQLYCAHAYDREGQTDVKKVHELDHLLRQTGDIDILIGADHGDVLLFFNQLIFENPGLKIKNLPNIARIGDVNINYVTNAENLKGCGKLFKPSLDEARTISIRRGNDIAQVDCQPIEYILAAKASGNYKEKDRFDIESVTRSFQANQLTLDSEKIREALKVTGKVEHLDRISNIN